MNFQDIKELMAEFDRSGIHKLELELEQVKINLEKEPPVTVAVAPATAMEPVQAATPAAQSAAQENAQAGVPVKSPVVGVFYSASAPDAPAFVKIGDTVQEGQTVCIIEAMKMMNEIKAPVTGKVIEILAENEGLVEYDQVIMRIAQN